MKCATCALLQLPVAWNSGNCVSNLRY